ncbi:target of rapamycin complex 2 subunit MAPKAP1-like [Xenia sp. Carnegie-2017]|uniref:target of rapamycin complex 2 subunit MAPKAP1-like n=1 Tax=Xenia sp. Carnegie-2017 TaxID=2897299 RepID=UPI001F04474E|nr:target of rapamycin complex 2 subunit MAPKAP1-like [Xenia sp. Carnegie-2017]
MAFMDDAQFVISQIRHSCVTSDDTGMSEIVIVNEETENEKVLHRQKIRDLSEFPNSFDIDVSPIGSGQESSTKKPLEVKTAKIEEERVIMVPWKDPEVLPNEDLFRLFPKKKVSDGGQTRTDGKSVSKLSFLVKNCHNQPWNPFENYSKFDGEVYSRTNKVRLFKIFFPLASSSNEEQPPEMNIYLIVENACVQDLIGLIMFKYTEKKRVPELKNDVNAYCLLIADEVDGEVDFDLPALDKKEMISKFDFKALALSYIEQEEKPPVPKTPARSEIIVYVCEERRGSSKFSVNSWDTKMKVVLEKMLKKRGIKRTGHEYVLVRSHDPLNIIDLEDTLENMETLEFIMIKKTSMQMRKNSGDKNGKLTHDEAEYFTLQQYKAFKVTMLQGFLHAKSEVQLGIDSRNIEITQTTQSSQRPFWNRSPRAMNIEMDNVVHCEITRRNGNRCTFRIIYSNENRDFKNYEFECNYDVGGEIVRKIENILASSPKSESWREFQRLRVRRSRRT